MFSPKPRVLSPNTDAMNWSRDSATNFNPYDPHPVPMPPWNPVWNEEMSLQPTVQRSLADQSGFTQFKNEATRSGPSEWANRATAQQAQQAQFARDRGAKEVAGQGATARANLAMHGGLGGGAAERIAKSNNKNYLDMSQNVGQEQARNSMQIGMNDEQNRMQQLGMVPGMEMARTDALTGAAKFDVGANMANNQALNQANQSNFETIMKAWGNERTADAQRHSGSLFICTALRGRGLMSKEETEKMTKLMLRGVFKHADAIMWYFQNGERAIELANKRGVDWSLVKTACVDDIMKYDFDDKEQLEKALLLYTARASEFIRNQLGHNAGWKESYGKPGLLKSLISVPRIFARYRTWEWIYKYSKVKLGRKIFVGGELKWTR